jgi:spermidine synthase
MENPLRGHFEYTEYFHLPFLWNTNITRVLMIGLGGGSTQRSFEHYYPWVQIQTVELDPQVLRVAQQFFQFKESERQKVQVEDGRLYLRRNTARHDLILLDAYTRGRYGSAIPQHLVTKEFFELTRDRLTTNGIVAYNVIGTTVGSGSDIVGAIYRTLKSVFPQVYVFTAQSSMNVVMIATKAAGRADLQALKQRAAVLQYERRVTLPGFHDRLVRLMPQPPVSAAKSPILTDDYAPVEGLAAAQ